ncbi:MAG: hypothetical protein ACK5G7_06270 [Erysipelotrichaceae bacterium]
MLDAEFDKHMGYDKNEKVFPSDDSLFKSLYLTQDKITDKWTIHIGIGGDIF